MLYRHKKVKKYLEGFVEYKLGKIVLYDEQKQRIDSVFSKRDLEDGMELDMERHYCVVQDGVGKKTATTMSERVVTRLPVGLKRKLHVKVDRTRLYVNPSMKEAQEMDAKEKPVPCVPQREFQHQAEKVPVREEELSNEQLLALFSGHGPQKMTVERETAELPATTVRRSGNEKERDLNYVPAKRNRFSAFADPDDSSDDDYSIALPSQNENASQPSERLEVSQSSLSLTDVRASYGTRLREDTQNSNSTLQKPRIRHKFKAAPLKALPNEFKAAGLLASNTNGDKSIFPHQRQTSSRREPPKPRKARSPQYQNVFGFSFNPQEEIGRLYRQHRIPTTFQTLDAYRLCWRSAILEVTNLEIADIASKLGRAMRKAPSTNLEQYMRSQKVPFYENVQLRSMESDKSAQYGSIERMDHVALTIQNKEHYSVYSKGFNN
jgi:hypothetical protein